MWFKNLQIFRLNGAWDIQAEELHQQIGRAHV